jgi:ribosomal protein S18 acetylase RimI-like enzyme
MSWQVLPMPANGPLFEGAIAVYAEAFAAPPYNDRDRGREVRKRLLGLHRFRPGYQAFVARHGSGRVIGMIYGYHGESGQWWHDAVRSHLPAGAARTWLDDSYELVEVAVLPAYQSLGVGRALIASLLGPRPEATCVLSTRSDSRAHVLYERLGFEVIAEVEFVPSGGAFYVMGKRLRSPTGEAAEPASTA